VFHEFDADGAIRTNRLHWEGFPRLAWEAVSAAGYLTPPTYEASEFERYGVPRLKDRYGEPERGGVNGSR
jgi:hypothetical protein